MSGALGSKVAMLETRIARVEGGHTRLADSIAEMKVSLDQNNAMTADIQEVMSNLKGFAGTVKWMWKTAFFIGKYLVLPVVMLSGLIYAGFHHGRLPEWWLQFIKFFFE